MKLRLCVIKKDITVLCDLHKGHIMLLCVTNDININHVKYLRRFSTVQLVLFALKFVSI